MDDFKKDDMNRGAENPTPQHPNTYEPNPRPQGKNTLSIATLVLGIVGIIFDFIFLWIGLIAGIVGIVLGVKARKEEDAQGLAMAGFVCSIIAVAIAGALLACVLCAVGTAVSLGGAGF